MYVYSGHTNDECQTKNYSFKIIPTFIQLHVVAKAMYIAGIYKENRVSHGQQTGYFNCLNMDGGF